MREGEQIGEVCGGKGVLRCRIFPPVSDIGGRDDWRRSYINTRFLVQRQKWDTRGKKKWGWEEGGVREGDEDGEGGGGGGEGGGEG